MPEKLFVSHSYKTLMTLFSIKFCDALMMTQCRHQICQFMDTPLNDTYNLQSGRIYFDHKNELSLRKDRSVILTQ